MKQKLVGTFILNHENVRVYATDSTGDSTVYLYSDDGGATKMSVACLRDWRDCVSGLMHEAMEFCLHRNRHGYYQTCDRTRGAEGFTFVFTHYQMNVVAYSVGAFVADVLPKLQKAHKEINARRKS